MTEAVKCHYCDQPAVVYCDFQVKVPNLFAHIGGEPGTPIDDPKITRLLGKAYATCDRPICAVHRRKVGHICDRSRRTTNNNSDTIDWCSIHEESP